MAAAPPPQTAFAGTLAVFLAAARPPATALPLPKTAVDGHWLVGRKPATLVATRAAGGGVEVQVRERREEKGKNDESETSLPPHPPLPTARHSPRLHVARASIPLRCLSHRPRLKKD